jgi:hypothetical protein
MTPPWRGDLKAARISGREEVRLLQGGKVVEDLRET